MVQAVKIIRACGIFDENYYVATYKSQDPILKLVDPVSHYLLIGYRRGYRPSPAFDAAKYIAEHLDVGKSTINPLLHLCMSKGGQSPNSRSEPQKRQALGDSVPPLKAKVGSITSRPRLTESRRTRRTPSIDVIIPVYTGYGETLQTVHSVLNSQNALDYELIVINDGSPDKNLTAELQKLAHAGAFTYVANARTLGFARTINRAIRQHSTRNLVLLNSDTLVFDDWLDRIVRHALPDVATITPFSNNASLCSYPRIFEENEIPAGISARELDQLCAIANKDQAIEIPTGVGFCMYVAREAINRIGDFDAKLFGDGYGEENDLCQRAQKAGFRNLHALDVFVYQRGGVSFADRTHAASSKSRARLYRKHPELRAQLRRFSIHDPSLPARQKLDTLLIPMQERNAVTVYFVNPEIISEETVARHHARSKRKSTPVLALPDLAMRTVSIRPLSRETLLPNLTGLSFERLRSLLSNLAEHSRSVSIRVDGSWPSQYRPALTLLRNRRGLKLSELRLTIARSKLC